MRKEMLFLLCVVCTLALASCNQNKTTSPEIVYVNGDTLFAKYNYAKDQNKILQKHSDSLTNLFQQDEMAFQGGVAAYKKGAATMPDAQRAKTEQQLGMQQQELQQMQQQFQQQSNQEQIDISKKLNKKLQDFNKDYAAKHNYKMILIYTDMNSAMLFGDHSLDITNDYLKELNDAYAKEKK